MIPNARDVLGFLREVTSLYNGARLRKLRTGTALLIAPWLKAPPWTQPVYTHTTSNPSKVTFYNTGGN